MTLNKYKLIFEALDNERRIELYEYILQRIFISKSELAKKYDLNRASLNHHLKIMLNAGIIFERGLILDGRKQIFITPAVILHPDRLVESKTEFQNLAEQLEEWTRRNLTTDTWRILKDEIIRQGISQNIVDMIEIRLFPSLMKRMSTIEICCHGTNIGMYVNS